MYKAYGKNVCDEYPIQLDLVFFFFNSFTFFNRKIRLNIYQFKQFINYGMP